MYQVVCKQSLNSKKKLRKPKKKKKRFTENPRTHELTCTILRRRLASSSSSFPRKSLAMRSVSASTSVTRLPKCFSSFRPLYRTMKRTKTQMFCYVSLGANTKLDQKRHVYYGCSWENIFFGTLRGAASLHAIHPTTCLALFLSSLIVKASKPLEPKTKKKQTPPV